MYATNANIQSEFIQTTFSATSQVTDTEIDEFIVLFSGLVNQRVSSRYTVPITDADALEIVELIVRNFVKARVMRILNSDQDAGAGETERTQANVCDKMAKQMLDSIVDGSLQLGMQPSTLTDTPSSFNNDNAIEPIFERDKVQW